ncbi:type II and III secretion system protein family protein [Halodesulfovibrio marinisediminis]|uniref:Pilus assembly protein CpaC n=1 Tax=Halodesulfovibrio marinisediminis DSM 17456 TaxID=1121457 RepID=A0A1N6EAG9_9BACT|nr:type II and III secretion system protein family protein [Halodesulfovibrio marinisediminis]SIN79993.1 pilus assembly protein CpaC [Halodesulfovibrio marinisediminis DSM 17456]
MTSQITIRKFVVVLAVLFLGVALSSQALAKKKKYLELRKIDRIEAAVGKSQILYSDRNISRISIADPNIADVNLLSLHQVYLNGKSVGTTTLSLWNQNGVLVHVFDVVISRDVTSLKRLIRKVLPDESDIKVDGANGSLTLSGVVKSPESVTTAVSLAQAYAPDKVVNLLKVGGVQQVMLEVRIAEVSKSVLKRIGINIAYIKSGQLLDGEVFYTFLNSLTGFDDSGNFRLSENIDSAFSFRAGGANWSGFVDALKQNGLLKVLAEPNVVCQSGKNGSFLAGGEIPIPVPQGLGTVGIEYRDFGVSLDFKPTVLGNGRINIAVRPEVSELDYTNAISVSGTRVPAITTRRVETSVELGNGQSFAIGGLISDSMRETIDKFPLLGDVPILGMLFRSSEFRKNLSELVVIVTPHLVEPVDGSKLTLPTDKIIEPNDIEFYVLGKMQGKKPKTRIVTPINFSNSSGFDGEVGHTITAD